MHKGAFVPLSIACVRRVCSHNALHVHVHAAMSEVRAQSTAKARNKLTVDEKCKLAHRKVSTGDLTRKLLRGLAKSRGSIHVSVGQWSGKQCVLDSTI